MITTTDLVNNTAMVNASKSKPGATEMDQDAFLRLLMTQLRSQDPLNPMDTKDFMSQQAQFTQISELQKLNKNVSSSNQLMQASNLLGKEVTLTDPDNSSKTITGTVTEAKISSTGASVVVNNEAYPLNLVTNIK